MHDVTLDYSLLKRTTIFSDLSIFAIFAPVIQTVTIMIEYIHRNIDSEEKSFIIMITHHKEVNARSQLALQ